MGSANLATVAPGISEALVATATGLLAAIPAVMAYNFFHARIRVLTSEMENFQAGLFEHRQKTLSSKAPKRPRKRNAVLPTLEFVLKNYKNFNARATRDALLAYWRHAERGGKMFWAVAGAMSSAQLGHYFGAGDPRRD